MSTTMPMHTMPSSAAVLQQQIRLLWLSRRPLFVIGLLTGAVLSAAAVMGYFGQDVGLLILKLTPGVMFTAAAWGVILWREEGPSRRTYHWTLPYPAARHDVMRVAAGAAWLLVAVTGYVAVGVLIGVMSGDGEAIARALPLLLPHLFFAPLTLYVLAAALATVSDRPLEWLLFIYLGAAVTAAVGELSRVPLLMDVLRFVFGKPYGLGFALVSASSGAGVRAEDPAQAELSLYYTEWLPIALLWLIIALVILILVARARRARA